MSNNCCGSDIISKHLDDILKIISVDEKLKKCRLIGRSNVDLKGENFLGVVSRLIVQGVNCENKAVNRYLFVKVAPSQNGVRINYPLNKLYKRECSVYTSLLPSINELQQGICFPKVQKLKFARCYKAACEEFEEMLIFEDLGELKFENCDRLEPMDLDHITLVVKTVARFHALGFALKEKKSKTFNYFKEISYDVRDYGAQYIDVVFPKMFKKIFSQVENPTIKEKLNKFSKGGLGAKFLDCLDLDGKEDHPYKTLCHGDCWSNNFLFKYEIQKPVDVIMLDWQMLLYGPPVSDLFFLIFCCTDQEFRNRYLEEVWDMYYATFQLALSQLGFEAGLIYPEDIYRKHIKDKYVLGFLYAVMLLPVTLINRNEVVDLGEMVSENGVPNIDSVNISKMCITRLLEMVDDLVERGIL